MSKLVSTWSKRGEGESAGEGRTGEALTTFRLRGAAETLLEAGRL